jgi:glycosyltransferase involved in cell wall biosynthesis
MKIAYIATKGMPIGGGIEKYTEEVGSRLVQKGHEIVVYCSRHYGAKDGTYKGIKLKTLPSLNSRSMQKLSLTLLSSIDQYFEPNVDIVHYHAIGPSIFCFMPRIIGRKTVVQSHGHEWMRAKWGWTGRIFFKLSEYAAMFFPNRITAVSNVLKDYYEKRYHREVVYIPTGITQPQKRTPDKIIELGLNGDDYILFAARHVEEKGAHYLIDAYQQINTNIKLVVAGDAQHEDEYKTLLRSKAAGNQNIIFPGFVQGEMLEELFSNASIYVLPSEIEGLPISLLEAMSYGCCCVVSDIPENKEALGGCGFLFKNKDVQDLRRCLEDLMDNKEMLDSNKESARQRVLDKYTWDSIANDFEVFYSELLEKNK